MTSRRIIWLTLFLLATGRVAQAQTAPQFHWWNALAGYRAAAAAAPAGRLYPVFESEVMTSSTSPSPVVITCDTNLVGYEVWKAFDKNYVTLWDPGANSNPHWLKYDCGSGNSNRVRTVRFSFYSATDHPKICMMYGSQDDATYTLIASNTLAQVRGPTLEVDTPGYYRYYLISNVTYWAALTHMLECELSSSTFINPMMTATNAPSPLVATADAIHSAPYSVWIAFGNYLFSQSFFSTPAGTNFPHWVQQDIGSNVVVNGFTYKPLGPNGGKTYLLEGSTDGAAYTAIGSGALIDGYNVCTNNNTTPYRYYKLTHTNGYNATYLQLYSVQWRYYP